ncbi:MAG: Bcr/CflA family drug resistance efflux transporter [Bacteroidetes bacterium]|nr:MAG: Bcr/CflA family drug resistance efflux transporter [Bacteroidota bacterium]
MTKATRLILILGAIAALGPLSIDMYLPGFPEMAKDLETEIELLSLSLTAYFIGISLGQIIYGPLLDRFGRKRPLLIGFSIYVVAALGCAMSPNIATFISMRFLLALGGCAGMVATRAIIRDSFEANQVARAFSALILVMGVAPILAPLLGGVILQNFGWPFIFFFLAIYALLILIFSALFLKESHSGDESVSLWPKQVFIQYEKVLKNRSFFVYGLAGSVAMAAMFTYISGSPFVVREVLAFDEIYFGWIFGANAIGYISASQINRRLLKSYSTQLISQRVSWVFGFLSLLLILQVVLNLPNTYLFLLNLFLFLSCLGFINPNMQALALSPFTKNAGVASALVGGLRMLSGAIASLLISLLHNDTALPMGLLMGMAGLGFFLILRFSKVKAQSN